MPDRKHHTAPRALAMTTLSLTTLAITAPTALLASGMSSIPGESPLPRVWSSSNENDMLAAQLAVDGNANTRWSSSFNDNQWLAIDLHEPRLIESVAINWNSAAAARYSIETSDDGVRYTRATRSDLSAEEGLRDAPLLHPVTARFLKIRLDQRNTQWGFSIHEILINGEPIAKEDLPTPPADALYRDSSAAPRERARDAVSRMGMREKIRMLSGDQMFYFPGNDRLGLRRLFFADASMGLRIPNSTAFPSFVSLAATFDPDLAARYGDAVAEECRAKGVDVLLGPGVNLYRVPQGGRNFEYLGEDPHLASAMVVPYIRAVQDRGVMATVKHFVANNHEWHRKASNSVVDDATLRTLYFPAFEAAVKEANVGAVMTAYNLVNGEYAAQHKSLVQGVLRDEWGFEGLVMTDWWSVYDPFRVITSGTNLEMPHADYLNEPAVRTLLAGGQIEPADIDRMVEGTLASFFRFGFYDRDQTDPDALGFGGWHDDVSIETSRKGMVLLKNDAGFLPLDPDATQAIVLLGSNARETETSGFGAARVEPTDPVSILASMERIAGKGTTIRQFDEATDEAVRAMRTADAVFVTFNTREREANDRDFELPDATLAMINAATEASDRVGVIVTAGSGVDMSPFVDDADAVLMAFFAGNAGNTAVGEILFGAINPSGKLPFTIERTWADSPAHGRFLPEGATFNDKPIWGRERPAFDVVYDEGTRSGYRHFDANDDADPLFAFGRGLSYTTFQYSDLQVTDSEGPTVEIAVTVTNTGSRAGDEIVQLYAGLDPVPTIDGTPMPIRLLKGFRRVPLEPGESETVRFSIDRDAVYPGQPHDARLTIAVGGASDDVPLRTTRDARGD